jgi:branched-chain amino acid transport system permease protein
MATASPTISAKKTANLSQLLVVALALGALALFLAYADSNLNGYRVQLVVLVAINGIVAVSLTLTSGFTGVFSLGQIAFMAIGAYIGSLISLAPQWKTEQLLPGLPGWLAELDTSGWPPQVALLFACLAGGVVAAVVAVIVGAPLMRLSGHYVAVATMGFLIIVQSVGVNFDEVTRGARGLSQIPTYTSVWAAYAWLIITVYTAIRLRNSPFGRSMIAARENQIAAKAIGINVHRSRMVAFVTGAFFAGVSGALLAHQIGTVAPKAYYFTLTFSVIIMVVLGGMGSVSGAVLGAAIITLLPEYLRDVEDGFAIGPLSVGDAFGLSQIIMAVGFILVMIFRPKGFFGDREVSLRFLARRRGARHVAPATTSSE